MELWRVSEMTGVITEVPGIGEKAAEKLADDPDPFENILTTEQLVAKYMSLKGPGDSVLDVNHKFWYYLKFRGVSTHRSAIVLAVNIKVAAVFKQFVDPVAFAEVLPEN
jgi:hypothetical protein